MPTEPLAFLNRRLLPQSQAQLPLHDAGFVWGATVTDLCRTVRHQLYLWPEHFARFRRSCRAAQIYPPLDETEIATRAHELVAHNAALLPATHDLALVLLATPGPIGYYAGLPGGLGGEATLAMHTFPLPLARYRRLFEQGARLVIPTTRHVPAQCVDPRIKQRSRMHWWLADREAQQLDPEAAALLLDEDGCITETAAANVLLVRDGVVCSPPRERILGGISLGVVEQLCQRLAIRFEERPLTLYDCRNAEEALLASTPYCLAGVSKLAGVPLPWPGPLWQRLLAAWSEAIGLDIRGQIMAS